MTEFSKICVDVFLQVWPESFHFNYKFYLHEKICMLNLIELQLSILLLRRVKPILSK